MNWSEDVLRIDYNDEQVKKYIESIEQRVAQLKAQEIQNTKASLESEMEEILHSL